MSDAPHAPPNLDRFTGFAGQYDDYRPSLPPVLADILTQLARMPHPHRVVDIGSGTGLSTRVWATRSAEVIGIEPNDDMRHRAEQRSAGQQNIRFLKGHSTATGLPDACADIIVISQALHWMEPDGTFAEIARLLRPGGIFAACDNDWPPTFDWEARVADQEFMNRAAEIATRHNIGQNVQRWSKDGHLDRMRASGRFQDVWEMAVHHVEQGNADRMVGIALSQASIQMLLKSGLSEDEIGLTQLRADAHRILGDSPQPWYFTYRVRLGVR